MFLFSFHQSNFSRSNTVISLTILSGSDFHLTLNCSSFFVSFQYIPHTPWLKWLASIYRFAVGSSMHLLIILPVIYPWFVSLFLIFKLRFGLINNLVFLIFIKKLIYSWFFFILNTLYTNVIYLIFALLFFFFQKLFDFFYIKSPFNLKFNRSADFRNVNSYKKFPKNRW